MRAAKRFVTSAGVAVAVAALAAAASLHNPPKHASIVIVPSRFDHFLIQTGDVKVTFRDGRSEVWTHTGDCHDVKVSPRGNVGWIRMDKKSVDVGRMTVAGKDSLVLRLLDGSVKEFPPFNENVCIMDWKFADDDTAVVVRSMGHHGPSSYVRYDIATGKAADSRGPNYTPYDKLPAWAKPLADAKND
jgi:hypothetical protein